MEGDNIPINKGFPNVVAFSLGAPHGLCSPIPNLLAVMTSVEEVFHGFLTLHAESTSRRSCKALFHKVVLGEDPILGREPKKERDFGPYKRLPNLAPDFISGLAWSSTLKIISFLYRERTR